MDIAVLGPLCIRVGASWVTVDARKPRLVFGVLLAHAGEVVDSEQLLEQVWAGQPPRAGLKSLRYHVSKLRDVLVPNRGPGVEGPIRTVGSGYQLVVHADELDADRFARLADLGAQLLSDRRWDQALKVIDEALGLWRGDAWQDFRYEEFAQPVIRRLEEHRLVALEDRIDARLGRGEHMDVIAELHELTTRHPLRERFWAQSITALHRADRTSEAVRLYAAASAVLGSELGIEPSLDLQHLHQRMIEQETPIPEPRHLSHGEPALPHRTSSFIGRERELDDLVDLLTRRRFTTVVGPGGVGKTSLALEAARRAPQSLGRVAFVDLAAVDQPVLVAPHVWRSCGVAGAPGRATIEDLLASLENQPHVIVFDNCEHVVDTISEIVSTLLSALPNVTVLATSRRPLHVEGEHVYFLNPLPLPLEGSLRSVESSDAVRLFVDRAEAARGGFRIDDRNRTLIVEACRRLDGLPLALELGASRLQTLSIDELVDLLAQPFELLTDRYRPREQHRTLWATIEWSHELLSERARTLLRRISVLRGTFDVDAITAVCSDGQIADTHLLDDLGELVETSFVIRRDDQEGGLMMLETIREFARHQLDISPEGHDIRERHAVYFAGRAAFRPQFGSREELEEVRRIRSDGENRITALDWALQHGEGDLARRLAAGLALHWYAVAGGDVGLSGLDATLGRIDGAASPERADALRTLGLSLPWMGRHEEAEAITDELARVADRLNAPEFRADVLWVRASRATAAGDIVESHQLFEEGASMLRDADHPKLSVFLFDLARRKLMLGDFVGAEGLVDELDAAGQRWNQPLASARVTLLRGQTAYFEGDVNSALHEVMQSLGGMRRLGLAGPQSDPLLSLCDVATVAQRWDLAEMAASDLRTLLMANGEIAALPYGYNTLAAGALDKHDLSRAASHVTEGLNVISQTRASVALDHTLLAAARVAAALDRFDMAAMLHAARAARRRDHGLVDPLPISRLAAHEVNLLHDHVGQVNPRPHGELLDELALVELAIDAVAA